VTPWRLLALAAATAALVVATGAGGETRGVPGTDATPPARALEPAPAAVAVTEIAIPPCAFGDATVAADPTLEVSTVLLDTTWRLPVGYEPPDLVNVAAAGFAGPHLIRAIVIDDLTAMRLAAEAAGVRLAIQSAYRSEGYQDGVHRRWVEQLGAERAREVSARPGHSEHQLGTAIDVRSADGPPAWDLTDWGATPEGAWVAAHAASFGFVISYPRGERARSCYDYEPWHLRWVGREMAAAVAAAGVPLRVHVLRHHPPEEKSDR
jgi:D-alanyl-D-alanine carboxypeptidase